MDNKEDKRKEYGRMIASIRKRNSWSQRQLATKARITPANIAKIELGQYSPGLDILLRLEEALGIERFYLNYNNIIMTEERMNTYVLGATDTMEFYKDIRDLPCFRLVEIAKDQQSLSVIWNEEYTHEYFPQPMAELCYLLDKNKLDWSMGPEEEYPAGTKRWWVEFD